jgi:hypothetical protein
VIAFSLVVLQEFIHSIFEPQPIYILANMIVFILLAGSSTFAWMQGARARPPCAATLGGFCGAVFGGISAVIYFMFEVPGSAVSGPLVFVLALFFLVSSGIAGFAGGLAIDDKWDWGGRPSVRAMIGLVAAAVLLSIVWSLVWFLLLLPQNETSKHPLYLSDIAFLWQIFFSVTIGWGLGLLLYPPSDVLLEVGHSTIPINR